MTGTGNASRLGPARDGAHAGGKTTLVLIRHGESWANQAGVVAGERTCRGLTEVGEAQARALADRLVATGELRDDRPAFLYASTLQRARETAEILAPAFSLSPEDVVLDRGWCELRPGEADGLTWEAYLRAYGVGDPRRSALGYDPDLPFSPGGESWSGFRARVAATLRRAAERHRGGLVVVATHAGTIEAAFLDLIGATARPSEAGVPLGVSREAGVPLGVSSGAGVPLGASSEEDGAVAIQDHAPVVGPGLRIGLRVENTSVNEWECSETDGRWRLVRFNDWAHGRGASWSSGA